ncbi:Non-canonical poly(A) RNA polymerase papd5, partial [Cladochytrium tenue]
TNGSNGLKRSASLPKKPPLWKPEARSRLSMGADSEGGPAKDDLNADFLGFDAGVGGGAFGDVGGGRDFALSAPKERTYVSVDPVTALAEMSVPIWAREGRKYSTDLSLMFNEEVEDYVRYISPTLAEHEMRTLTVERLRMAVKSVYPSANVYVFGSFETKLYLPTSFNVESGPESARIVQEFLDVPNLGPGIRGMMYVMKQFLLQRHLNEPFTGGLGSYGLLILVASFLMMHPMVQSSKMAPEENLGTLILEFLQLYGKCFNFFEVGIAVDLDEGTWYFRKDRTNDVGAGSFNFHQVRSEFHRAYLRVVCMIGATYERNRQEPPHAHSHRHRDAESTRTPARPPQPNTILGGILAVRRGLFEFRRHSETLAARVRAGTVDAGFGSVGLPRPLRGSGNNGSGGGVQRNLRDVEFDSDHEDDGKEADSGSAARRKSAGSTGSKPVRGADNAAPARRSTPAGSRGPASGGGGGGSDQSRNGHQVAVGRATPQRAEEHAAVQRALGKRKAAPKWAQEEGEVVSSDEAVEEEEDMELSSGETDEIGKAQSRPPPRTKGRFRV